MAQVTISDRAVAVCELNKEYSTLRAEADKLNIEMADLLNQYRERMIQISNRQRSVLSKMEAIEETMHTLLAPL